MEEYDGLFNAIVPMIEHFKEIDKKAIGFI